MKIKQLASLHATYGDIGIVKIGDAYVLIDAGIINDRDNIVYAINRAPIHTAIISHWHEDHIGSFRNLNYGRLILGNSSRSWEQADEAARQIDALKTAADCGIKVPPGSLFIDKEGDRRCQSFQIKSGDETADFYCISPAVVPPRSADFPSSPPIPDAPDENHYSMLTMVTQGPFAFLSFGDITQDACFLNFESFFLPILKNSKRQVIKLPHHGSARNCVELLDVFRKSGYIKPGCHFIIPGYSAQVSDTIKLFGTFFDEKADIYLSLLTHNPEAYRLQLILEIQRRYPGRLMLGTQFDWEPK